MSLPGSPLLNPRIQFFDANGDPLSGGLLYSYEAGSSTPLALYTASDLDPASAATNPVELNAAGRPATNLYMKPQGYKLVLQDEDLNTIWTADNIEDVGAVAFATLGNILATGSTDVTSGYVIDNDDNTVTVLPDASPDPCVVTLPSAADRGLPLTVILLTSTVDLSLTPDGADTINGVSGAFTIAPGTSPIFSGVTLNSDGVSNWTLSAYWTS